MALILCQGLRGGVGSTFISGNLAIALAQAGHTVTAIDFAERGTLALHFGLGPDQPVTEIDGPLTEEHAPMGVALRRADALVRNGTLEEALALGKLSLDGPGIVVADVATGDSVTRALLQPYATLDLQVLNATAESLSALPHGLDDATDHTTYLVNMSDDTRRFCRHMAGFLRELLGDRLLGSIRRDEAVIEAGAMLQPLSKYAPSSASLKDVLTLVDEIAPRFSAANATQDATAEAVKTADDRSRKAPGRQGVSRAA